MLHNVKTTALNLTLITVSISFLSWIFINSPLRLIENQILGQSEHNPVLNPDSFDLLIANALYLLATGNQSPASLNDYLNQLLYSRESKPQLLKPNFSRGLALTILASAVSNDITTKLYGLAKSDLTNQIEFLEKQLANNYEQGAYQETLDVHPLILSAAIMWQNLEENIKKRLINLFDRVSTTDNVDECSRKLLNLFNSIPGYSATNSQSQKDELVIADHPDLSFWNVFNQPFFKKTAYSLVIKGLLLKELDADIIKRTCDFYERLSILIGSNGELLLENNPDSSLDLLIGHSINSLFNTNNTCSKNYREFLFKKIFLQLNYTKNQNLPQPNNISIKEINETLGLIILLNELKNINQGSYVYSNQRNNLDKLTDTFSCFRASADWLIYRTIQSVLWTECGVGSLNNLWGVLPNNGIIKQNPGNLIFNISPCPEHFPTQLFSNQVHCRFESSVCSMSNDVFILSSMYALKNNSINQKRVIIGLGSGETIFMERLTSLKTFSNHEFEDHLLNLVVYLDQVSPQDRLIRWSTGRIKLNGDSVSNVVKAPWLWICGTNGLGIVGLGIREWKINISYTDSKLHLNLGFNAPKAKTWKPDEVIAQHGAIILPNAKISDIVELANAIDAEGPLQDNKLDFQVHTRLIVIDYNKTPSTVVVENN